MEFKNAHHGRLKTQAHRQGSGRLRQVECVVNRQNCGKSMENDPTSLLSHLARERSPAYIGLGCRWPRSCRSVRTSNGSNRGSARVAWCFQSTFGCSPHAEWGVHRLGVPAVTSLFGTSSLDGVIPAAVRRVAKPRSTLIGPPTLHPDVSCPSGRRHFHFQEPSNHRMHQTPRAPRP
jgi:hypothetical protein